MIDELQRLRDSAELCQLLEHYARVDDRAIWQERRMDLGDVSPRDLVKLHGELLAYGWLEQNTGAAQVGEDGALTNCYRVTSAGQRSLREIQDE
jgi:hypothetical protein